MLKLKSALISGGLAIVLALGGYIVGIGDLWKLNPHALVNIAVMAFITTIVSLIKSSATTSQGTFAGVQINNPTPPVIVPIMMTQTTTPPAV
jgi:hypothetical protein